MPENLGGYIGLAVTVIWFIGILAWFFRRQYGKTKTATATVVSKQVSESVSKYSGTVKSYYVTFSVNGKHRSFKVSEFSYGGYRKGETGTLKYKGDRLIDFS